MTHEEWLNEVADILADWILDLMAEEAVHQTSCTMRCGKAGEKGA